MPILMKRIYEEAQEDDGTRILVDRVWPRVSREKAKLDLWMKEVAPSDELRKWYGHEKERFGEFRRRYLAELTSGIQKKELERPNKMIDENDGNVTLLYGAKDEKHNQAEVLKKVLEDF
ncbi:DUF488 domain-containing protein [Bhargavaea changchunensis]|uniref:DUF488 domain-containing protein n=2 Tax=Bhargavaea changchunensis TaxID=2134037 RepID=A0ABW2NLC1_9BACL|nr:DUF488 family protein [Bhargavaea sp. CC-171006]